MSFIQKYTKYSPIIQRIHTEYEQNTPGALKKMGLAVQNFLHQQLGNDY